MPAEHFPFSVNSTWSTCPHCFKRFIALYCAVHCHLVQVVVIFRFIHQIDRFPDEWINVSNLMTRQVANSRCKTRDDIETAFKTP